MSEEKRFANMYWNYEDVRMCHENIPIKKAEEFLSSIEDELFSWLAEVGVAFIRSHWEEKYPDWDDEEEYDEEEEVELKKEEPIVEASPPEPQFVCLFWYVCEVCEKDCEEEDFSKARLDNPICDDCEKDIIRWDNMDFGTEQEPQCGICNVPQEDAYWRHGQLVEDVICCRCIERWYYDSDMDAYRLRIYFEE